ncbi:B3 domain-containing transcription factor VRN1-like [Hibiscus syriacus]|uniref:B3 domain-containing transcription factor VRN1-like n=1 Tax=Hibiscus syriacus TaxID=106335 RepID=UPI001920C22A|nr:B3 domain-containing transcription factor VRN1-like [Hibiscus syriacus]
MASKSLLISLTLASHLGGCHKPHHFFKVVVEDATRSGKVGIPAKFARDYGNSLSNPVFIKVPSGKIWELELVKCGFEIYEGGCHFHVIIFDRTATEIEYPDFEQEVKVEESDDDEELVKPVPAGSWAGTSETISSTRSDEKYIALQTVSRAFKSTNPFFSVFMPPSYVGPITNHSCSVGIPKDFSRLYLKDNSDVVLCDSDGKTWAAEYMSTFGSNGWAYGGETAFGSKLIAQETALQRALAFISDNPYFVVVLRASYMNHSLRIPKPFSWIHLESSVTNINVNLCLSNGKSWPAMLLQRSNMGSSKVRIHDGWRAFVDDNNLHVGDVCVLEMTNHDTKISFKVHLFHAIADAKGPLCSTPQHHKADIDMASTSKSPMFKRVVLPGTPYAIFERYLTSGSEMVRLKVEDRWWPVKITSNR